MTIAKITITHADGRVKTIQEWAAETGIREKTIRARIRQGWDESKVFDKPKASGTWAGYRRKPYKWRCWKSRNEALAFERTYEWHHLRKPPRDMWDVPLERDPWARAAIESASESPFTLDEVGHVMGITRERVRQIEEVAIRKIKRALHFDGAYGALLADLRDVDALRSSRSVESDSTDACAWGTRR